MEVLEVKGRPYVALLTVIVLVVGVIAGAVLIGVKAFSSAGSPSQRAGFRCVPDAKFPALKRGHSTTLTASYGGFTAKYAVTFTENEPTYYPAGTPFNGTLKISTTNSAWQLARPDTVKGYQLDALCVVRFKAHQTPAVMIEGFTGGAHCCELPVFYAFDAATKRYVKTIDISGTKFDSTGGPMLHVKYDFNGGFRPRKVGKQVLLETEDGQFAYEFGCYACTPMPLRLDTFSTKGLRDVTSRHANLVATEARGLLSAALTQPVNGDDGIFGELAAWTADECVLGKGATAWTKLLEIQRTGVLKNSVFHRDAEAKGPFITALRLFLLKNNYCAGQI
jgi:hypothetical protein